METETSTGAGGHGAAVVWSVSRDWKGGHPSPTGAFRGRLFPAPRSKERLAQAPGSSRMRTRTVSLQDHHDGCWGQGWAPAQVTQL